MKKMKRYLIIPPILFIFISLPIISAQEQPKYNFGSMQAVKELSISPGGEEVTKLYFYNIHGNRITHISLFVSESPENWDIFMEPPLHDTTVNIGGLITTVTENLYVEPAEDVEEVPEEAEYISSPVGVIWAKPVKITIKVPEDEELGTSHDITISASAEWLGETGTVIFKQERDFDFNIKVVPKEFREEIVTTIPETTTTLEERRPIGITGYLIANYSLIGIIIVLVILIIALSYYSFFRGRRVEEIFSYLFGSK